MNKGLNSWFEFAAARITRWFFAVVQFSCLFCFGDRSLPSWLYQTIAIGSPSEPREIISSDILQMNVDEAPEKDGVDER